MDEIEFNDDTIKTMNNIVAGKTIKTILNKEDHGSDFLVFKFSDDSSLKIRYDYIFDFTFGDGKK